MQCVTLCYSQITFVWVCEQMGERRDRAIKELRDELAGKQQIGAVGAEKQIPNFWESSGFKIVASMSMLILVVFSKR